jgi:hypothetical protein
MIPDFITDPVGAQGIEPQQLALQTSAIPFSYTPLHLSRIEQLTPFYKKGVMAVSLKARSLYVS